MSVVTHLGHKSEVPVQPGEAVIDCVPAPIGPFCVRFTCPEFTSICPVTGQPDFATIVIDYVPNQLLIESKSLKLYLFSFRNHGAFHEDCVASIGQRLYDECEAMWMRVAGYFYPRGGIPIDVFWMSGEPVKGVWLPQEAVTPYRPRI